MEFTGKPLPVIVIADPTVPWFGTTSKVSILSGVVKTADLTPVKGKAGIFGKPVGATKLIGKVGFESAACAGVIIATKNIAATPALILAKALPFLILGLLVFDFMISPS